MGVRLRRWGSIMVLATLWSAGGSMALAQDKDTELAPLDTPTATSVLERNNGLESYWGDDYTLGDAQFLFNITPAGNRVHRAARRIEAFYNDYLEQMDKDNPIVRTRDLASPFSTSVKELKELE